MRKGRIGIFAGKGDTVSMAKEELFSSGESPLVFSFDKEVDADIYLDFGDIDGFFSVAKQEGITRIVLIGKIEPHRLFFPGATDQFPGGLSSLSPEKILSAAVKLLRIRGIQVVPLTLLFSKHIATVKTYSSHKPDETIKRDIHFGWKIAKRVARAGIGQAVAMNRGMVVAVEAVEGTDRMIARAGLCAEGFTVVKVMKKGQSVLYDLPTVGPATIREIVSAGGRALAVEAGRTIIVGIEKTVKEAEREGIVFLGTKGRLA